MNLGIDAGGSSTKWALVDEGGMVVASGRASALRGHLYSNHARQGARGTLEGIWASLPNGAQARAVYMGVTGLSADSEVAGWLKKRCKETFNTATVAVVSDMDLAYRAHYAPGEGIVVYAGTGSIAYHLTRTLEVRRAGGRGYLIDDAGGGWWIGREALRALMRALDAGQVPDKALADLVFAHIGSGDWDAVREYVYGGEPSNLSALAPLVGRAAEQGSPVAAAILDAAGAELAALGARLLRQTGSLSVTLLGGALRISPRIAHSVRAAGLESRPSTRDLAVEAARLAAELHAEPRGSRR